MSGICSRAHARFAGFPREGTLVDALGNLSQRTFGFFGHG